MSSSASSRLRGIFKSLTTAKTTSRSKAPKPTTTTTTTSIAISAETSPPAAASASAKSSDVRKFKNLVNKFKEQSNSARFRGRGINYETAVRRFAAAKQFSCIEEFLEHQKQYKDITSERFTVRLIGLYGKYGMFEHAHKLFDEMPQLNCKRTVMSFNALLAACVNSKKFDKLEEFLKELPGKLSIEPDIVSYNTLVKGFCDMDSLDSALLAMDQMEKNGFEPDLITFNTLLQGFYRNNRSDDAEKLWVLMEEKKLVPNSRSYNPKLRGLVTSNRISEAVELIGEMGKKGVKPDVYSFSALIKGYCDEGNLEEAKRWFGEIGKSDCVPILNTLKTLIPFACEKGDCEFASQLFKDAIKHRILVYTAEMQLVIDLLVKESKTEEAKELVELAESVTHFRYKLKIPVEESS